MKIKSKVKKIFFQKWITPVSNLNSNYLWVETILQTSNQVHFFFGIADDSSKVIRIDDIEEVPEIAEAMGITLKISKKKQKISRGLKVYHVMSIPRGYPYRVMDEAEATYCLWDYLIPIKSSSEKRNYRVRTWKLWGTPFSQECNSIGSLSDYDMKKKKDVVEYLVCTEDEWIECISPLPTWKSYKGVDLETLVTRHLRGDLHR